MPNESTRANIVVLNYNGRDLLEMCLPSIMDASRRSRHQVRVTVLDNQSHDESEAFVRERFPDADFVKAPANRVFCSYNDYVTHADEEFVILLNNDIRVEPDFVDPLLEALLHDPRVFFSAPRALGFASGEYEGSLSKLEFRRGLPWGTARFSGFESKIGRSGITMQCGFGAFRRSYFLELGGFDDLYLPGTVEDTDICFRAWRRGWTGVYCPKSVVYHLGQATFKKAFGTSGIRRINRRNLYLFVWKNIESPRLILSHLFWMPVQFAKYVVCGEMDFVCGFMQALRLLPRALRKRGRPDVGLARLSDEAIFEISRRI